MGWEARRRPAPGEDWADGYVVDTSYTDQVVPEVCPAWLSMAAVLHGQPPLPRDRPLRWLDLGAGTGLASCVVAAANPDVEVWGCDINPAHVERAASVAARAGLDRCHVVEAGFADVAGDDDLGPAEVDVIVVNGVYSWISPANQRHLAEIVRRRLRPGGLAFVMYETAAGWAAMVPVAEALRLLAADDGRRGDRAFPAAAGAVTALADAGARAFPLAGPEAAQMASWAGADPMYGAHEYLGAHFAPLVFDQVAGAMAAARCAPIGGIEALDHLPAYWAPPGVLDVVTDAPDPVAREMIRDLLGQRPLRRDLFRRGLAVATPSQHAAWVRAIEIVGLGVPFADEPVAVPGGQVRFDPAYHAPLVEALEERRLDVDAIRAIHPGWSADEAAMALALQVAAGYAAPAVPGPVSDQARDGARRLNSVLVDDARLGANPTHLVVPATGSALALDPVEVLVVGALGDGHPADVDALVAHVGDLFAAQGRTVREEGVLVDEPVAARAILERRVRSAITKRDGPLRRLGAV